VEGSGHHLVNLELSDDQRGMREMFGDLFTKEVSPDKVRAAEPTGHDAALWRIIVSTGVLGVAVPETQGGGGAGLLDIALIAEEAGRRLAPVPIPEPAATARLLARCGADALLEQALDGSVLVSLTPRLTSLPAQLLPDGAVADFVLVLDKDRIVAVARPNDVRPARNMGSLPMARWVDAEVSGGEVVASGLEAVRLYHGALDEARVLRASTLVGLAQQAIEIGAAYAKDRHAFGVPIGTYQGVAHPLADAVVAADGAQLLVWKACWALEQGEAEGPALASMALLFAGQTAYRAAQHCLHIHGGYGFMAEYDIQLYYRRAKAWLSAFTNPAEEIRVLGDRCFGPVRAQWLNG
jgi:alkylation response protein AidB-like acyl-CoA dehydrogenase